MLNNTWILSHDDESVAAMKNMLTYLISGFDVSSVSLSLLLYPRRSTCFMGREMNSVIEQRRRDLIPSTIEFIRSMATRLYFVSSAYVIYYTLMISLNTLVVAFVLTESEEDSSDLFLTVETFIASVLILEVIIRLMALGVTKYLKSWFNVLDLVVAIACVFGLSVFFAANSKGKEIDDAIIFTLIGVRYSIPLLRLLGWISSRSHDDSGVGLVDFDAYDKVPTAEEEDDDNDDAPHQVDDSVILELVSTHASSSK